MYVAEPLYYFQDVKRWAFGRYGSVILGDAVFGNALYFAIGLYIKDIQAKEGVAHPEGTLFLLIKDEKHPLRIRHFSAVHESDGALALCICDLYVNAANGVTCRFYQVEFTILFKLWAAGTDFRSICREFPVGSFGFAVAAD